MALDPKTIARISAYFSTQAPGHGRYGNMGNPAGSGGGGGGFGGLPAGIKLPGQPDAAQTPQNVGQWLLNALATGTYITANIGNEVGRGLTKTYQAKTPDERTQGQWETATAGIMGALRGVGEGLGFRFDRNGDGVNERPRTWGQNLEDLGSRDLLGRVFPGDQQIGEAFDRDTAWLKPVGEGIATALGYDTTGMDQPNDRSLDPAGTFAQGVLGTIADIGLDPTTYLSLGTVPLIRGALKGSTAAVKAGENVVAGALKGGKAGWLDARTAAQNARIAQSENAALRRDFRQEIRDGVINKRDIPKVRTVLAQAGVSRQQLTPEVMAAVTAGLRGSREKLDEALTATTKVDTRAADGLPDRSVADQLAPTLEGTAKVVPTPEQVRAAFEGALVRSTEKTLPAPKISAAADRAVRALADEVPDAASLTKGISTLQRMSGGKEFLAHKVDFGGKKITVKALLEATFSRRVSLGDATAQREVLDVLLRQAGGDTTAQLPSARATFDPSRLATIVKEQFGHELTKDDIVRFLGTPTPDKLDVLRQIVGGQQAISYDDFAGALAGAARGELSLDSMRKMADALGIRVPAGARPTEVRSLLKTEGQFNWAQIQAATKPEPEVLLEHGLDDTMADVAAAVDVPMVKTELGQSLPEGLESLTPFVPPGRLGDGFASQIMPGGRSRRGQGAYAAIYALGEQFAKRADSGVESFDLLSNQTMRSIWSAAARAMQPTATKLTGAERAAFGRELTEAMRIVEAWGDAVGSMPHIYGRSWTDTYFVRFSDILDNLGTDVADEALFKPLTYRNVPSNTGLTIYPTTIARAAAEALKAAERGFNPAQIEYKVIETLLKDSKRTKNQWAMSAEGIRAQQLLGARMADPEFTSALLATHTARKPVAAAMSMDVAGRTVTPIGDAVLKALAKVAGGGDRAAVFDIIDAGWNAATRLRGGKDPGHLVDDVARERLNMGFVHGILGEAGSRVFKADTRAARANNPQNAARSATEMSEGARAATEQLLGRGPSQAAEGAAQKARRGQQAQAAVRELDDGADTIAEAIDGMIARGEIPDTALARIETMFELESHYGGLRILHKLGVAGEGSFGQVDVKGLLVAVNGNTFRLSGLYADDLVKWAKSIKYAADKTAVQRWWTALARVPAGATDDEIRALLSAGQRANPLDPAARQAIPRLAADEVERALELKQFIDVVFSEGPHGLFSRSGVIASDLAKEFARINFRDGADKWAKFNPDRNLNLAEQTGLWRTWELESGDDVLDALTRYHTAIQASSVKPSVGASVTRHFSHTSEGLSAKEAEKLGWQKIDTQAEDADLARFIDPDAYFPPEIIKQLTYTQQFLNASKRFDGQLSRVMGVYDAIMSVLKSSNTIWRPGHHVTNILGETFMNFMAGVNPLRYRKGLAVIKAGGDLTDGDLGPLAQFNAANTPAGYSVKESFASDAVQIVIKGRDGKKTLMSIDPQSIWKAALDHSVAMTHGLAEDILAPIESKLNPSALRQAATPLIAGNEGLMRFSALRDNVFRLTHFVDALEKGQFSSLDDAFRQAARVVHDYHPTMQTLSAFEQKYARRIVFFYTWQRQAISRVLRTALDQPGLVTFPSKLQYNMAEANGLNPDSFGMPVGDDERIASYGQQGLYGPTFRAGMSPFDQFLTGPNLWGYSLSAPQMDGIQSLFKGANVGGTGDPVQDVGTFVQGTANAIGGQLSPLIKGPAEVGPLLADGEFDQAGEYVLGTTGLPNQLNNAMGGNPNPYNTDEQNQGDQMRALLNMIFGLKFTNYTSDASAAVAKKEREAARAPEVEAARQALLQQLGLAGQK